MRRRSYVPDNLSNYASETKVTIRSMRQSSEIGEEMSRTLREIHPREGGLAVSQMRGPPSFAPDCLLD